MKVVATRPNAEIYLIETEKQRGFVANLDKGVRHPEKALDLILVRGKWDEFRGDDHPILERIEELRLRSGRER